MNATCQQCDTVFRIDPDKVPAGRVRVRCSICRAVFEIRDSAKGSDEETATAATPDRARIAESGTGSPREDLPREGAGTAVDSRPPEEVPPSHSERRATSTPTPAPAPASAPASAPAAPGHKSSDSARPARPAPTFGSKDPDARARRLARALVSDMATYHPDRRNRALEAGNLKDEFREEIKKSWQEYVEQVGMQTARETPHFRDALNDILAKGNRIF